MHGRTYKVLKGGETVTIWGESAYAGERGVVIKRLEPNGVKIRLDMGHETVEAYRDVAMGDNSQVRNEE